MTSTSKACSTFSVPVPSCTPVLVSSSYLPERSLLSLTLSTISRMLLLSPWVHHVTAGSYRCFLSYLVGPVRTLLSVTILPVRIELIAEQLISSNARHKRYGSP